MEKTKNLLSYVLGVCLMALVAACANEINEQNLLLYTLFEKPIPGGVQVGYTSNGDTACYVKIYVTKNPLEVAKSQLGSSELTEERRIGTQNLLDKQFEFNDAQIDRSEVYDPDALISSVEFKNCTSEKAPDGTTAQMNHNFTIGFNIGDNEANLPVRLPYTQYVKGAPKPDVTTVSRSMAVTTKEEKNGLSTTITATGIGEIKVTTKNGETGKETVKTYPFTTTTKLTLTALLNPIEVEKFGTSCTKKPEGKTSDKSSTAKTSIQTEYKSFLYKDGQKVDATTLVEYEKIEGFEVPKIIIRAPEPLAAGVSAINDKEANIVLPFSVNYQTEGLDVEVNGTVKTSLNYKQVKKEAELTWKVDSTYTTLSDGSMIWYGKLTRSDGVVKEKRAVVAFVGDVNGRDVFGVSEAKVVKKNDTHKKHSNMCTTTTEGEWTITKDYETWRWERYFANPENKDLTAETEIVFWTQQLTFKDPETGWTLTTKPLVKNCVITQDEIINEAGAPKTKQDGDHDHDYTYVGTHKLTVKNTLDGNFFHASTATCLLYKW